MTDHVEEQNIPPFPQHVIVVGLSFVLRTNELYNTKTLRTGDTDPGPEGIRDSSPVLPLSIMVPFFIPRPLCAFVVASTT